MSLSERFWSKAAITEDTDSCWLWKSPIARNGYARFSVRSNLKVLVHRFAFSKVVGEIPPELTLDHLCRNRACLNPWHLEPVTMRINILRGNGFAAKNARVTHCPKGHEYSAGNIYCKNRDGARKCRACALEYQRRRPSRPF